MPIQVWIDGGIVAAPGLAKPINLDEATLPPAEQVECGELVRAAVESGNPQPSPSPAPDARNYRILIDSHGMKRSLVATDTTMPAAYSKLINFVRKHGSR